MLSYMVRRHINSINKWTLKIDNLNPKISKSKMVEQYNIRWAFNTRLWEPTYSEILAVTSYIQAEEKERISKFIFQEDAKSSLIGRLMLRKYVNLATSIPYNEVRFNRDDRGKPFLAGVGDVPVSFNVSHQSDYVVLAGHPIKNIGIDVMKIEPPAYKNIPDFLQLMNRQFSPHEWKTVKSFPTEMEQIACFYRLWCLKESYVKNLGLGITVPLNEISFNIQTPKLQVGKFVTNTTLIERNVLKNDWVFEETLLDDKYAVAVSLNMEDQADHSPSPYQFITFEQLVKDAKPLSEPCAKFSTDFMNKKLKNC